MTNASAVTIKINATNAAFGGDGHGCEVARILRKLADELENPTRLRVDPSPLYDVNGNKVGTCRLHRRALKLHK